jgi:hypothetical protein
MEPERPIEKLLRAFAKKRREQSGAPLELHSAMRQQLQKEIARRSTGAGSRGRFSKFFMGLRPKLAFALCFVALLIMGLMFLPNLMHPKPSTLASANGSREQIAELQKTAPAAQSPPLITMAAPAAGERRDAIQDKQPDVSGHLETTRSRAEPTGANRQLLAPVETPKQQSTPKSDIVQTEASTGTTVAATPPSRKEVLDDFKATDAPVAQAFGGASALSKDAVAPALPSAPPTTTTALAANEESEKKLNTQKQAGAPASTSAAFFARNKSDTAKAAPPVSQSFNRIDTLATRRAADAPNGSSPVLLTFRLEQTGNALRVVDADGSVYTGAVQVAQAAGAGRATSPKNAPSVAPAARAPDASDAARNYSFRVAGTNRSSKENVVFSGNLIPLTNAPYVAGAGNIGGFGGAPSASQSPSELQLSNSRISGTAVIGNQKTIEVIATPAP